LSRKENDEALGYRFQNIDRGLDARNAAHHDIAYQDIGLVSCGCRYRFFSAVNCLGIVTGQTQDLSQSACDDPIVIRDQNAKSSVNIWHARVSPAISADDAFHLPVWSG
jgi:hypothetical protein